MGIQKDIFQKIISNLNGINQVIIKMKQELLEKDKRIKELENKLAGNK